MAEEKKTTTRKTTPKKTEVEEVKVEKRFCTECGKELKEGEVYKKKKVEQQPVAASSINGDAIINTCKDIWHTILNMFKKPASTIEKEIESPKSDKSIILIIVLAISFALYLMALLSSATSEIIETANNQLFASTDIEVGLPYFKIFIYGILIYGIMAILPVVAALIVGKIAKNNNFTFKKAFKLYITSNAPQVFAYLGMAIILLLDVSLLTVLGTIASLIISIYCFFNFILGFNSLVKMKDDRRSYGITGLIALWLVMAVVVILIIGGTVFSGIVDESYNIKDTINNNFDW